uniref:BACK domain-containing protein n=1 Tax=Rhabditophanes sp. KR3021 TaxID=114890 RepID=A0AC35TNP5_9BILA
MPILSYFHRSGVSAARMLAHAREKSYHELYRELIDETRDSFDADPDENQFHLIDYTTLLDILDDEYAATKSQGAILKVYISWLNYDFHKRNSFFLELLKRINFRFVSCRDIKEMLDQNKRLFEIDDVAVYIFKTLFKRGFSINPNSKPTEILMLCIDEEEECSVFDYNLCSNTFCELSTLENTVSSYYYTDSSGVEVLGDNLLIFCNGCNFDLLQYDFMTRKTLELRCKGFKYPSEYSTCKINGEILMFGESKVYSFDPNKIQFNYHSKMPDSLVSFMSVQQNNVVYIVCDDIERTLRFDPREGLWERCGSVLFNSYTSAVCAFNDAILKAGGCIQWNDENGDFDDFVPYPNCEMFETRTNGWREIGALPVPLRDSKCCQVESTVQLFGGSNDLGTSSNIYTFNESTETWSLSEIVAPAEYEILSLNLI